jgi:hypothetical protein
MIQHFCQDKLLDHVLKKVIYQQWHMSYFQKHNEFIHQLIDRNPTLKQLANQMLMQYLDEVTPCVLSRIYLLLKGYRECSHRAYLMVFLDKESKMLSPLNLLI